MAMESGRIDMNTLRKALSITTLTLHVRPALRAWEAFERELERLDVAPAIVDRLAVAAYEAIVVAAFKRRTTQSRQPPGLSP